MCSESDEEKQRLIPKINRLLAGSIIIFLLITLYGFFGWPDNSLDQVSKFCPSPVRSWILIEQGKHVSKLESTIQALGGIGLTLLAFNTYRIKAKKLEMESNASNSEISGNAYNDSSKENDKANFAKKRISFSRKARAMEILFFLSTIIYFFAMINRGQEDAAVFMMAIVAIYLAAEHYVSLEGQHKKLGGVADKLDSQVESLKNALGVKDAVHQILTAYQDRSASSKNNGIFAVYEYFEIDNSWWRPETDDIWKRYLMFDDPKVRTIFNALKYGKREQVMFVTSMCLPSNNAGKHHEVEASEFAKFIGLVWYYVLLHKTGEALRNLGPNAIQNIDHQLVVVRQTPNWMHVVDDRVFQIFGVAPKDIKTRELTFDLYLQGNGSGHVDNKNLIDNIVKWAIADIRRSALRGCPARDYIYASVAKCGIRLNWTKDRDVLSEANSDLDSILNALGFKHWFTSCKEEKQRYTHCPAGYAEEQAKALCENIMIEFLKASSDQGASVVSQKPLTANDFIFRVQ